MWLPPPKEDIAYYSNKISHIGSLSSIYSILYMTNFCVYPIFLSQSVYTSLCCQEGANAWTSVYSFKAVVKDTLLFESKTWLMNPRVYWNLGGSHKRVDLCLVGMIPRGDIMGR